jgi:hypothetical protein
MKDSDSKKAKPKQKLHPALQANADRLKARQPLSPGTKGTAAAKKKKAIVRAGKKRG